MSENLKKFSHPYIGDAAVIRYRGAVKYEAVRLVIPYQLLMEHLPKVTASDDPNRVISIDLNQAMQGHLSVGWDLNKSVSPESRFPYHKVNEVYLSPDGYVYTLEDGTPGASDDC